MLEVGRTHLQDAVPVTLGQEFSGWASQVDARDPAAGATLADLEELPLGGTAVGTGLNAHPEFAARTSRTSPSATGLPFRPAENRSRRMGGAGRRSSTASGALKAVAVDPDEDRPRPAAAVVRAPLRARRDRPAELQPGSSIMPGKVNPVIPEVAIQVAAQVIGNDAAIDPGGALGVLELNVMLPVMARNLLESVGLLSASSTMLASEVRRRDRAEPGAVRGADRAEPGDGDAPGGADRI